MEIMVYGAAKKFFSPDEIIINFDFNIKADTYSEALENGVKSVENFIKEVLQVMNFSKTDLKTKTFTIVEEIKYDYELKKEIKLGFVYRQVATLKFDYSLEKVSKFMERIKDMSNPPKCKVLFGIKNEEEAKSELLADAYIKAKQKAEVIAKAATKTLKECKKVDFKPFDTSLLSDSNLDNNAIMEDLVLYRTAKTSVADIITNIYTPEDIEVKEEIYCLWLAE